MGTFPEPKFVYYRFHLMVMAGETAVSSVVRWLAYKKIKKNGEFVLPAFGKLKF